MVWPGALDSCSLMEVITFQRNIISSISRRKVIRLLFLFFLFVCLPFIRLKLEKDELKVPVLSLHVQTTWNVLIPKPF